MEKSKKTRRIFLGEVISNKMEKTLVVKTTRTIRHPIFGKTLTKYKCYKVHDENGQAKAGDLVEFFEGRPVSKTKYMYLARVVTHQAA